MNFTESSVLSSNDGLGYSIEKEIVNKKTEAANTLAAKPLASLGDQLQAHKARVEEERREANKNQPTAELDELDVEHIQENERLIHSARVRKLQEDAAAEREFKMAKMNAGNDDDDDFGLVEAEEDKKETKTAPKLLSLGKGFSGLIKKAKVVLPLEEDPSKDATVSLSSVTPPVNAMSLLGGYNDDEDEDDE